MLIIKNNEQIFNNNQTKMIRQEAANSNHMHQQFIIPLQTLTSKKCFKSIIYLSFVVLFYISISNTQLAILSQFTSQSQQNWVGPLSTSLLFLGSGMGSLYNKYIQKIQYKYLLFIGSLGYTLFIGLAVIFLKQGFSLSIQILILIGSFISGLTVSVYYNTQFNYVNVCSQIDKQPTRYFGINLAIMQSANIVGNTISALLIKPLGQFLYAIVMNISVFVISLFFLSVKDYQYPSPASIQKNINNTNQYHQIVQNSSQQNRKQSLISVTNNKPLIEHSQLNSNFQLQKKFPVLIYFAFCFSGIMISFIFCQLSLIFYDTFNHLYDKQELNRITFIAFIIEGVGQFFGGLSVVFGEDLINKRLGISLAFLINSLLFVAALFLAYIAAHIESLQLLVFSGFIAGYCDCLGFTLGLSIAGRWKQKGLSLFNIGQSSTVAITAILIAFIKYEYIILWCIFVNILSSIGILLSMKKIDSGRQNKGNDQVNEQNQYQN